MKPIRIIPLIAVAILALASCMGENKKQAAQGKPYEIIVVAATRDWDGALEDTVRSILGETIPVLNAPEPMYTVSRIGPSNFINMLRLHRNVIMVDTGDEYTEPGMHAQYDVYSAPQIIVTLSAPDAQSLTQYVSDHRKELQSIFEITERNRSVALNKKLQNPTLNKAIFEKFGFDMVVPSAYVNAEANATADFMWLRKHYQEAEQGVMIYKYPYTDRSNFMVDSLLKRRNEFLGKIEGTNKGSYMTTAKVFTPIVTYKRINGRDWAEMRGFWDMQGDFYGGPFISYSTLDADTRQVVTIDMYILSPNHGKMKRNYYRELQHLMYGVSFPSDKAAQAAEAPGEGQAAETPEAPVSE